MSPRCARLTCGEPAAASTLFVADESRVELIDLADATAGIPLCAEHARRLTAPVGWELVDRRTQPVPNAWDELLSQLVDVPARRREDPVDADEVVATFVAALSEF